MEIGPVARLCRAQSCDCAEHSPKTVPHTPRAQAQQAIQVDYLSCALQRAAKYGVKKHRVETGPAQSQDWTR